MFTCSPVKYFYIFIENNISKTIQVAYCFNSGGPPSSLKNFDD
jgi:hypothetical protein